jgi:hypothetical protein
VAKAETRKPALAADEQWRFRQNGVKAQPAGGFQKYAVGLSGRTTIFRTSTQKPKLEVIRRAAVPGASRARSHQDNEPAGDGRPPGRCRNLWKHRGTRRPARAHLENDLNLSSLGSVELMSAIENRYQVDLGDREFSKINTVADLENRARRRKEEGDYPYPRWTQNWLVRGFGCGLPRVTFALW